VKRKVLLKVLAEELPPDTIRFSSKLISIKSETPENSSKVTALHLDDGTIIKAKVYIVQNLIILQKKKRKENRQIFYKFTVLFKPSYELLT
jgi:hypothetical protein